MTLALDDARSGASTLVTDAALIDQVRDGDAEAFAELYRRHHGAALAAARAITSKIDPDDLASEAFSKILVAIRNGNGPKTAFRAYLLTTVRNTAATWGSSNKEDTLEDFEVEDPKFNDENIMAALDRSLTATAFRKLPQRWQEVLWYTEVESMSPAEAAPLLGLKAGAVPALAYRAREGLRQAWIQAHFENSPEQSECRWAIGNLGANARQALRQRDRTRMDAHLETCERCSVVAEEAEGLAARLALVLLPITIGAAAAAGYLTFVGGASSASAATVAGAAAAGVRQTVTRTAAAGAAAAVIVAGIAFAQVSTPVSEQPPAAAAEAAPRTVADAPEVASGPSDAQPQTEQQPEAATQPQSQGASIGSPSAPPPPVSGTAPTAPAQDGSAPVTQPGSGPTTPSQPAKPPVTPPSQPATPPPSAPPVAPPDPPLLGVGTPITSISIPAVPGLANLLSYQGTPLAQVKVTLVILGKSYDVSSSVSSTSITLPDPVPAGTAITLNASVKLLGVTILSLSVPVTQ